MTHFYLEKEKTVSTNRIEKYFLQHRSIKKKIHGVGRPIFRSFQLNTQIMWRKKFECAKKKIADVSWTSKENMSAFTSETRTTLQAFPLQ